VANFNEQQLLRDAQAYLEAGDPAKAIAVYDQILAVLPNDTKAQEGLTKAQRQLQLDTLYHQASNRIQAKQWADAEKTLQELLAIDPKYKDAAKKLATVQQERKLAEQQNRLGSLFQEAQSYFEAGNWPMAARNYAAIFDADPSFEEAAIKDRLPKSLLNWANQLVASAGDSLLPYQQAIDLYDKALLVQPRDSQIVTARKLVTAYLDGYKLYGEGRWADAVEKLEPVYQLQTDYAGGRLAQLLYDAYIKNGDALAASRDDQAALDQYRKALALDVPDHSLAQSREHETSLRLAATGK
jgi:tetratricopeptide (TPR) repeat protein